MIKIRLTESELHRIIKEAVDKATEGEKILPKVLIYDLEGFRGFGVVKFPLCIEERLGRFVGHYSHDGAGWALACAWGDTKEEVIEELYRQLKMDYNYKGNSSKPFRIQKRRGR